MNSTITKIIESNEELERFSDKKIDSQFKVGARLLGVMACEEFLDIPEYNGSVAGPDGYFYQIVYYDKSKPSLWYSGHEADVLVVYERKSNSTQCPIRISFQVAEDRNSWKLVVHYQGSHRNNKNLYFSESDGYYTDYGNLSSEPRLSDLISEFKMIEESR